MKFEQLNKVTNEIRPPGQAQGTITSTKPYWLWICVGLILLSQYSCNQPRDRSSYNGSSKSFARVSVRVGSQSISKRYRSKQRLFSITSLPTQTATALIIAVDAGTTFSENYNNISPWYDRQLVDLTTSTVTMDLPLDTPLQLFEYTFNQSYSLGSLSSANQIVFSKAIMGPFTVTGSTSSIELTADLDYAVSEPFNQIWNNGSHSIEKEHENGIVYHSYETTNWQTLESTSYLFDPTSNEFVPGQAPSSGYELVGTDWIVRNNHALSSTFDRVDIDNYTIYYTNPNFSATLVDLVDLPSQGLEGEFEDGDGDEPFMAASDFTQGAIGYIFEINGQTESEYTLERIAESHDCTNTEYTSLNDYIDQHTSSEFTCQGHDGDGPCLRFESFTPGQTGGFIIEVIRDIDYNIISETPAGTWEITLVQTHDMLFFYPDDPNYYHDGLWATFWTLLNGKVWEGYYPTESAAEENMYFMNVNDIAIANYRTYLQAAPPTAFIDNNDSSCNSQSWGQAIWGNFSWGP